MSARQMLAPLRDSGDLADIRVFVVHRVDQSRNRLRRLRPDGSERVTRHPADVRVGVGQQSDEGGDCLVRSWADAGQRGCGHPADLAVRVGQSRTARIRWKRKCRTL